MGINKINALLTDMSVFVRVVESGSFSAAARALGMTPSAVSRQVSRLERALSSKLMERNTRNLRLTEFGAQAFERCQRMLESATEVLELAEITSLVPTGVLRVSTPKAFGKQVIHPLIPEFLTRYPDVDIHLFVSDQKLDPITDQLDLIISITDNPIEGLVARRLVQVRQYLCASPGYLEQYGTPQTPADLANHRCLFLGETASDSTWHFRKDTLDESVQVRGRYSVNHTEARLDCVLRDMGISCLPDFTAQTAVDAGEVVRILPDWEFLGAYQGWAYIQFPASRYLPPKTRVFIDYLVAQLDSGEDPPQTTGAEPG